VKLLAVAKDGDRLPRQRLPDEVGDDHPVLTGLPGSDCIEQANHDDGELALLPVCQAQELVDHLAARVRPAVLVGRAEHEIRAFREGHGDALSVDLGGRGDEHQLPLLGGVLEDHLGAVDVRLDRIDRLFDDELYPDGGREVNDDVAAIDHFGQERLVGDRVDGVVKAGMRLEVLDVVDGACRQVVEHEHFVATFEQCFGKVAADEPGPTGDEYAHAVYS
jgi:hypothetical protein